MDEKDPGLKALKENMLEAMVEASLLGHDLAAWEPLEDEGHYRAVCRRCHQNIRISGSEIQTKLSARCSARPLIEQILSDLRGAAHGADTERFDGARYELLAYFSHFKPDEIADDEAVAEEAYLQLPPMYRRRLAALERILERNRRAKE